MHQQMSVARRLAATAPDPFFSSVTSLMSFRGRNNDLAPLVDLIAGNTWTLTNGGYNQGIFNAGAEATASFPTGSEIQPNFLFDLAYMVSNTSANFAFGSGSYTVDCWLARTLVAGNQCLFDNRTAVNQGIAIYISVAGDGKLTLANSAAILASSAFAIPSGTFVHIEIGHDVISGNSFGFINGTLVFTVADVRTLPTSTAANWGNNYIAGSQPVRSMYLNNARITVGVCRHTANFSPPFAPFPNF